MRSLVFAVAVTFGLQASALNLTGTYGCSDKGTLTLRSYETGSYLASLEYADGSASALVLIAMIGESLKARMIPDDSEGDLGEMLIGPAGQELRLRFNDGEVTTCRKR